MQRTIPTKIMSLRASKIILICSILACCGCGGFERLETSEYGVVFNALPTWMGGGLQSRVLQPSEKEFLFPWETLYRLDTSLQSIAWGGVGHGDNAKLVDYVETRAIDGNEVGLGMTINFHINPTHVAHVIQYVGTTNERIRVIVEALARSEIRTHMNILHTREFFSPEARFAAVQQVKKALNTRLEREGIVIDEVIYNAHRFERKLLDGTVDRRYQAQLDETQAINQETEQEEKRILSVSEQKKREYNETKAKMNRIIEEADGYKRQATFRGDAYLEAKQNEAEQVRAVGTAEVEGLKKQIAALKGPGGEALLRMTLAKELMKSNPKFVVLNSGEGGGGGGKLGFDFNKLDTNQLLHEMGVTAGAAMAQSESRRNETPSSSEAQATPDAGSSGTSKPEQSSQMNQADKQ